MSIRRLLLAGNVHAFHFIILLKLIFFKLKHIGYYYNIGYYLYVISYFINFVLKQNYRLQTHSLYAYTFDRGFSGDTTTHDVIDKFIAQSAP